MFINFGHQKIDTLPKRCNLDAKYSGKIPKIAKQGAKNRHIKKFTLTDCEICLFKYNIGSFHK